MSDLYHLMYVSKETKKLSNDEVIEFLKAIRKNNIEYNITGMLLYDDGIFFQVIEGSKEHIENLFQSLLRDSRHHGVVQIIFEAIYERKFADWSMGYAQMSKEELSSIEAMNDFFKEGSCLMDLDSGRAKKLLKAFADGRWRIF